jgi:hypothetical protein
MNDVVVPRLSRRRAAVTAALAVAAVGVPVGALWAWLAPAIHGVVALTRDGDRVRAYLGNESDNFFTSAFLLAGMLIVLAVVAALTLWQWRTHRGPVLLVALAVGGAGAAAVAAGVGAALVRWRYGAIDIAAAPVSPEHRVHYVTEAPSVFFGHSPIQIAATLLFPAAVAALVYALVAVSTDRDDLGAWPPVEPRTAYYGPPTAVEPSAPLTEAGDGRPGGATGRTATGDAAPPVVP